MKNIPEILLRLVLQRSESVDDSRITIYRNDTAKDLMRFLS